MSSNNGRGLLDAQLCAKIKNNSIIKTFFSKGLNETEIVSTDELNNIPNTPTRFLMQTDVVFREKMECADFLSERQLCAGISSPNKHDSCLVYISIFVDS